MVATASPVVLVDHLLVFPLSSPSLVHPPHRKKAISLLNDQTKAKFILCSRPLLRGQEGKEISTAGLNPGARQDAKHLLEGSWVLLALSFLFLKKSFILLSHVFF